jgi:hypothetical protein
MTNREQLIDNIAKALADRDSAEWAVLAQAALDAVAADCWLRPKTALRRSREAQARADLRVKKTNDQTMASARNRGQEWTSHELEVADREDLSNKEIAVMLGRTLFGVKKARNRLNHSTSRPRGSRKDRWTGPELELAARKDLSEAEVANMVGRTPNAVSKIRHKLRTDPRYRLQAVSSLMRCPEAPGGDS